MRDLLSSYCGININTYAEVKHIALLPAGSLINETELYITYKVQKLKLGEMYNKTTNHPL